MFGAQATYTVRVPVTPGLPAAQSLFFHPRLGIFSVTPNFHEVVAPRTKESLD
jgi:hypothetical protein